jgi:Fur family transcriptional regulator, peroxide stress response regulator
LNSLKTEERLAEFVDACRQQGIKATHQRREIFRELVQTKEHPDAKTLYDRVRQRVPAVSLDTVYRTLKLFEEKGIIWRVGTTQGNARYDANTDPHGHFICSECGMIWDVHSEALNRFTVPHEVAEIGSVDTVCLQLRGRCWKCQAGTQKRQEAAGPKIRALKASPQS